MNEQQFQRNGTVLEKYIGPGGEVTVPLGITEIGSGAFAGNQTITALILPESLKKIGFQAFYQCTALEQVQIADGVTFIHNMVFQDCTSLRRVRLPETMTYTGKWMFRGCTGLESVTLPASVEYLAEGTFQNCTALKEMILPDRVGNIFADAFAGCSGLQKVHLGKKVHSIWARAFAGCTSLDNITVHPENEKYIARDGILLSKDGKNVEQAFPGIAGEYYVPDGVETVGMYAFQGCDKITALRFAPSVTSIQIGAFQNCKELARIEIPATVKEVQFDAFTKQTRWNAPPPEPYTELIVAPEAGEITANMWLGAGNQPVCYPQLPFHFAASKEDKQRMALGYILNSEKYADEYAKGYLKYVKSQRKTLIALAAKLKRNGVAEFYADLDAKSGSKSKKNEKPASLPVAVTEQANPMEEFDIAQGVLLHYLGTAETVVVPDTVTEIGEKAFYDCKKLEKVVFPQSVTSFAKKAFVKCPKLKTVVIHAPEPALDFNFYKFRDSLDVIAPNASPAVFSADYRLNSIRSLADAVWNNQLTAPAPGSKLAGYLKRASSQLTALAQKTESVLDLMLRLEVVSKKDAVWYLDNGVYGPETKAKLLALSGGKESAAPDLTLEKKAPTVAELKKDWSYGTIILDKSYTGTETIKGIALKKYKGIQADVEIPSHIGKNPVVQIGAGAFSYNHTITSVTIPETIRDICDSAFEGCDKLTRVAHYGNVLKLGSYIFKYCRALESFTTTAANVSWGIHPFNGCNKLFDTDGFLIMDLNGGKVLVETLMPIQKPELRIPDGVVQIGKYAVGATMGDYHLTNNLQRVILPDSVKHIDDSAFANNKHLYQVNLPDGLETIGSFAFTGCEALRTLYVPASVRSAEGAFWNCYNLTVHGKAGSYAEECAQKQKVPFLPEK